MGDEQSCSNTCLKHENIEDRVTKLEEAIVDIRNELKAKAVTDARIEKAIELMSQTLTMVQNDTTSMRNEMIKLVAETLEKTRMDMSSIIQSSATNDEKDREWQRRSEDADKRFYRKLIMACVSVLATIVLAYFGIKAIIPLP